jgi:hypothetical protein
MKKRIHGFLQEAIAEIQRRPGQSAHEIVDRLLRTGDVQSAAVDPYPSLEGTLHKHHEHHGVERRKEGGVYRYYPVGSAEVTNQIPTGSRGNEAKEEDVQVTLRLPRRVTDVADALVAAGTRANRAGAVAWLVEKGIASLRA